MTDLISREIKLCLLGDSGVGKSSLALRFVNGTFNKVNAIPTIGASFLSKIVDNGDEILKYNIWDTAGQEKYKPLAPMYFRGAAAAIIVYDITMETSFESVEKWVKQMYNEGSTNVMIAIAGNKKDLEDEREIPMEKGLDYANSIGALFTEVSALTAENVNFVFEQICKNLPRDPEAPTDWVMIPSLR